ncbi:hypothetical protein BJX66DRAFT_309673 [Aspergillus keveii]|uniref:Uncharacterized protein n=1 Tax=Aspergillus keveii TaxID=714993 RepID=A0ABR4FXQ6_9EURO
MVGTRIIVGVKYMSALVIRAVQLQTRLRRRFWFACAVADIPVVAAPLSIVVAAQKRVSNSSHEPRYMPPKAVESGTPLLANNLTYCGTVPSKNVTTRSLVCSLILLIAGISGAPFPSTIRCCRIWNAAARHERRGGRDWPGPWTSVHHSTKTAMASNAQIIGELRRMDACRDGIPSTLPVGCVMALMAKHTIQKRTVGPSTSPGESLLDTPVSRDSDPTGEVIWTDMVAGDLIASLR